MQVQTSVVDTVQKKGKNITIRENRRKIRDLAESPKHTNVSHNSESLDNPSNIVRQLKSNKENYTKKTTEQAMPDIKKKTQIRQLNTLC